MPALRPPADSPDIAAAKKPEFVDRAVDWTEHFLPMVWADRVSRSCLLAAVAFFWLTVTLTAPVLILPFAAACAGIWYRRDERAAAAARLNDPDFD
jgi:hypothetical protein